MNDTGERGTGPIKSRLGFFGRETMIRVSVVLPPAEILQQHDTGL